MFWSPVIPKPRRSSCWFGEPLASRMCTPPSCPMISGSVRAALRAMSPAVITRVPIAVPSARSGKRVAVTTTASRVSCAVTGSAWSATTSAAAARARLACMARSPLPASVPASRHNTWRTATARGSRERRGSRAPHPPTASNADLSLAAGLRACKPGRAAAARLAHVAFPGPAAGPSGGDTWARLPTVAGAAQAFGREPVTCFPFHPAGRKPRRAPRTSGSILANRWQPGSGRRGPSGFSRRSLAKPPLDQAYGVCRASRKHIENEPLILDRTGFSQL